MVYPSMNIRKTNVITHIYVRFNQNHDEQSYISAKIEIAERFDTAFLLTAEQHQ